MAGPGLLTAAVLFAAGAALMAGGPGRAAEAAVTTSVSRQPLYFVENRGQSDSAVVYYALGNSPRVAFTANGPRFLIGPTPSAAGAVVSEEAQPRRWVVAAEFVGPREGLSPQSAAASGAVVSYFRGPREAWKTGLSTSTELSYRDGWPGIDVTYSGTEGRLKSTFVAAPGADPTRIRIRWRGATGVQVEETGALRVVTPAGNLTEAAPFAYQEREGRKVKVQAAYRVRKNRSSIIVGFRLGPYDPKLPLVIDPVVLGCCGYIGGADTDYINAIAVDSAGNAYVAGATRSTEETLPVKVGPDLTYNSSVGDLIADVFVAKVSSDGTGLVYCGYIGGAGEDWPTGIGNCGGNCGDTTLNSLD